MKWSKYDSLKTANKVAFSKEKEVVQEEIKEEKDSDGKVIVEAKEKVERDFVLFSQKKFDVETGEALDDLKREYSLSELEREKSHYDNDMARVKAESDGLAKAIEDFKKL